MSDRFVLHAGKQEIEELLGATASREDYYDPNYNIHPGDLVPVLTEENGERQIQQAQWGLIPDGADEESEGRTHYRLPADELKEGEDAIDFSQRCVIPASGFYKWKTSRKKTTPFYIRLLSREVMGLAGIYSVWQSASGRDVYSFTMLEVGANALVQPVDEQMPVILEPDDFSTWLSAEVEEAMDLLHPYRMSDMAVNRVTEKVNNLDNNSPELIQPIPK